MNIGKIIRLLNAVLQNDTQRQGMTSIPFVGMISATRAHRLHSVSLQQSAAIVILSGQKVVTMGAETCTLSEGDIFLYPSMQETTIENIPDPGTGRYMALCLSFNVEMLADVLSGQLDKEKQFSRIPLKDMCASCTPSAASSLTHLLEMAAAHPGNKRLLSLCLEEFLILISEETNCLPMLWQAMSTWTARCGRLVGMKPERKWTAHDVAKRMNISERTLRRNLGEEGASLSGILREVRISTGLSLLQTGNLSVSETASRCGYSSASRFAGLFKERFGVSPSEVLRYKAESGSSLAESV